MAIHVGYSSEVLSYQRFVETLAMANGTEDRDLGVERDLEVGLPAEDDLEHLLEDNSHLAPPSEGELLAGHVIKVTPTEAYVDVGYKLEGVVPIEQLRQPDGSIAF